MIAARTFDSNISVFKSQAGRCMDGHTIGTNSVAVVDCTKKRLVLSQARMSYSFQLLGLAHKFLISPQTCPKLGLILSLCEIDLWSYNIS